MIFLLLFWFSDSLKQVVGHEAIKLLVSVDEDGYEAGRLKLLQNLKNWIIICLQVFQMYYCRIYLFFKLHKYVIYWP